MMGVASVFSDHFAASATIFAAVISACFAYVQISNARRAEVLDLLASAYQGEVAKARAGVGAAFEKSVSWGIAPSQSEDDSLSLPEPDEGNLVRRMESMLNEATSPVAPVDWSETLDQLYAVLWFFNRVDALRRSFFHSFMCTTSEDVRAWLGLQPRPMFRFGCRGASRLLDDSIAPLVKTYLRYYGPYDPERSEIADNVDRPELTAGNGHEGLMSLARSLNEVTESGWRQRNSSCQ